MKNILGPSINMLPMEDIAAELRSDKDNRKFLTKEDLASDVEKVGGIPANKIAIAIDENNRTTVENALNLDGKSAKDYYTSEKGKTTENNLIKINNILLNEIKDLHTEMYSLNNELIKRGFTSNFNNINGMAENFNNENIQYHYYIADVQSLEVLADEKNLYIYNFTVNQKEYFEEGHYFILKRKDIDKEYVLKSKGINDIGRIDFEVSGEFNPLEGLDANKIHNKLFDYLGLYKSNGIYVKNSYSFSKIMKNAPSENDRHYTQLDDTSTCVKRLNKDKTGFATIFKVPDYSQGILSKFKIIAEATRNPGSLICYVLDRESIVDNNGNIIATFKNIAEAKAQNLVLAESKPTSRVKNKEVTFEFYDPGFRKNPLVKSKEYCFIIECISANEFNYWDIKFSYFKVNNSIEDLQRYYRTYAFEEHINNGLSSTPNPIDVSDLAKLDLMFTLVTKPIQDEAEIGKKEGLYTTNIFLPNRTNSNKVRVEMRIAKEGIFKLFENKDKVLKITNNDPENDYTERNKFDFNNNIIIGNQIKKVAAAANKNEIELQDNLFLNDKVKNLYSKTKYDNEKDMHYYINNIPVYRMNYEIYVTPKYTSLKDNSTNVITKPIKLNLIEVLPDGVNNQINNISERLIFEADLLDEQNKKFLSNDYEVQIVWKSPYSITEINEIDEKVLIGRINQLVITFNEELTIEKEV